MSRVPSFYSSATIEVIHGAFLTQSEELKEEAVPWLEKFGVINISVSAACNAKIAVRSIPILTNSIKSPIPVVLIRH